MSDPENEIEKMIWEYVYYSDLEKHGYLRTFIDKQQPIIPKDLSLLQCSDEKVYGVITDGTAFLRWINEMTNIREETKHHVLKTNVNNRQDKKQLCKALATCLCPLPRPYNIPIEEIRSCLKLDEFEQIFAIDTVKKRVLVAKIDSSDDGKICLQPRQVSICDEMLLKFKYVAYVSLYTSKTIVKQLQELNDLNESSSEISPSDIELEGLFWSYIHFEDLYECNFLRSFIDRRWPMKLEYYDLISKLYTLKKHFPYVLRMIFPTPHEFLRWMTEQILPRCKKRDYNLSVSEIEIVINEDPGDNRPANITKAAELWEQLADCMCPFFNTNANFIHALNIQPPLERYERIIAMDTECHIILIAGPVRVSHHVIILKPRQFIYRHENWLRFKYFSYVSSDGTGKRVDQLMKMDNLDRTLTS